MAPPGGEAHPLSVIGGGLQGLQYGQGSVPSAEDPFVTGTKYQYQPEVCLRIQNGWSVRQGRGITARRHLDCSRRHLETLLRSLILRSFDSW